MGRVYEALKRAAQGDAKENGADNAPREDGARQNGTNGANGNGAAHAAVDAARPDALFAAQAAYFNAPDAQASAHSSAHTEHTIEAHAGSALPGGAAARDAGATVGADGSTRDLAAASFEVATSRVEPHLVAITDPRSPHAEQYRSLRTRVLHAGERRKVQAVVVTSAGVAEGKTVTALNLAWLLAQTDGVRALLIDGDLRQPCAAHYLALDAPVGLSEVLAGQAKLNETIVRLEPAGLYLLPGGTPRDNCAELLSGPKFSAVLAELRRSFNYIIIDAPPLGIFTDANVLINRADGALIVVRANRTRFSTLDRVLEPLPRERLLGVVLNGAAEAPGAQSYYYQRRYYRREEADTAATPTGVSEEDV
jgi:capsular exopolysaccharide synthesis family protein